MHVHDKWSAWLQMQMMGHSMLAQQAESKHESSTCSVAARARMRPGVMSTKRSAFGPFHSFCLSAMPPLCCRIADPSRDGPDLSAAAAPSATGRLSPAAALKEAARRRLLPLALPAPFPACCGNFAAVMRSSKSADTCCSEGKRAVSTLVPSEMTRSAASAA